MGNLMLKELVRCRVLPIMAVVVGSFYLASCSSSVSRFDFPIFGLSGSDEKNGSTASFGDSATRLDQRVDDLSTNSDSSDYERSQSLNARSSEYVNPGSRNSYLPPQTAAPEVRSARYGDVERKSLDPVGGSVSADHGRSSYASPHRNVRPMEPIKEARRSFLPSEPSGYRYDTLKNANRQRIAPTSGRATRPAPPQQQSKAISANGQTISVEPGDTLYSISRRSGVAVKKLMRANDLADSNISVGQKLVIPGAGEPIRSTAVTSTSKKLLQGRSATGSRTALQAKSRGTYTVRSGETFRTIAGKLGVDASELADLNGITDTGSIRPGEVLILPANRSMERAESVSVKPVKQIKQSTGGLKVRSVKTKSIAIKQVKAEDADDNTKRVKIAAEKNPPVSAFRWPVRGRIIGKFGENINGTHNDGINLAVPNGTKVKAAEAGVVAYAGSELKGYGNLVLIRHAGNWVSAYAHNEKLMVKRGDEIKRGQVIARAGKSGSVEQPQVHFELRKGSKPVDPIKYMAGT